MPHFEVRNQTPFGFESLLATDEEAFPQFVPLLQATFDVKANGELALLDEQPAPTLAGEWHGDPATSSMKLEPQTAFMKPSTDVVLVGHAYAPKRGAAETMVGISVGPVRKLARVVGDRFLVRRSGASSVSAPEPFETIPLTYERAFGGWDRRHPDAARHSYEVRNPVGVGFRMNSAVENDEMPLPNIEDPENPYVAYGDRPAPTGFGFVAPNWQPRLSFAGTYDAEWSERRKPLLPTDFDRRFFNAASPGLIAPTHLQGNEPVIVVGASSRGRLSFHLPGLPPPTCVVRLRGGKRLELTTQLDTILVDTEVHRLTILWRAHLPVRNGPHDVVAVDIDSVVKVENR